MSFLKKLGGAVLGVVGAVVGFAVGGPMGAAIGFSIGSGIGSIAQMAAMDTKVPDVSSATSGRLNVSIDPDEPRKIAFGETALGTDEVYWESFGPENSYFDRVIVAAGHTIWGYGDLYFDDEKITFDSDAATGAYAEALNKQDRRGWPVSTALTVGAGEKWTENATLTGLAHYALKYKWSKEKFPRGFSTRITREGEGALVYDPRRDSTQSGGSGTHRADDQSTWEYAPLDSNGQPIGRNPALQILWYEIGWRVQNPSTGEWIVTCGRGRPLDDIDFESFITAANDCEDEEYYSDVLLSTGDAHETNIAVLEAACAGKVMDTGGLIGLRIRTDTTGDIVQAFGDDDVLGNDAATWRPSLPLSDRWNIGRGSFVDPRALYQLVTLPVVRDATYEAEDGFKRAGPEFRFDAVQDPSQAQKLIRLEMNVSRYQGVFTAPFGWRAKKVRIWDCVTLSFSRLGFEGRIFRVLEKKTDPMGAIWLLLREDDPSIYSGGTVTPVPAPAEGAGYDPRVVSAPQAGDWTITPVYREGGGAKVPIIAVTGGPAAANIIATHVWWRKAAEATWTFINRFPAGQAINLELENLSPGGQYYLQFAYENAYGVVSEPEEFGPYTLGDELIVPTASEALTAAANSALADALAAREDATERLAEIVLSAITRIEDVRANLDKLAKIDGVPVGTRIQQLTSELVDLDSVLAEKIDIVSTRLEEAEAAIVTEQEARSDADSAAAAARQLISAALAEAEATFTSEIQSLASDLETAVSQVALLEARVDDAETQQAAFSTALNGVLTRITTAEGTLTSLSADYTDLVSRIEDAEAAILAEATARQALQTEVTQNADGITALGLDYTQLASDLGDAKNDIVANTTAYDSLFTYAESIEDELTLVSARTTTLESNYSDLEDGVAINTTATQNLQSSILTINGQLASFASFEENLTARISAAEGTVLRNPRLAIIGSGNVPTNWSLAAGSPGGQAVTSEFSYGEKSFRYDAGAGQEAIFSQTGAVQGGLTYKLTVALNRVAAGSFAGAGIRMQWRNSSGGTAGAQNIPISTLRDTEGVISSSKQGLRIFEVSGIVAPADAVEVIVYVATHWSIFGSIAASHGINWHYVDLLPEGEIEATTRTLREAFVDAAGNAIARIRQVVAASGSDPAVMSLESADGTSRYGLIASTIRLFNNVGSSTVEVMRAVGGYVFFSNPVSVSIGAKRLTIGPNGNVVLWFGPSNIDPPSQTRTNGHWSFGTDGKVYYGNSELLSDSTVFRAAGSRIGTYIGTGTGDVLCQNVPINVFNGTPPYYFGTWQIVNGPPGASIVSGGSSPNMRAGNLQSGQTLSAVINTTVTDSVGNSAQVGAAFRWTNTA